MKIISASELAQAAPYRDIVEALRQGFRDEIETPVRHQHQTSDVAILLLMPAFSLILFFVLCVWPPADDDNRYGPGTDMRSS